MIGEFEVRTLDTSKDSHFLNSKKSVLHWQMQALSEIFTRRVILLIITVTTLSNGACSNEAPCIRQEGKILV